MYKYLSLIARVNESSFNESSLKYIYSEKDYIFTIKKVFSE